MVSWALGDRWHREPHPGLRDHFALTWFHLVPSTSLPPLAIVPDGYADLQWINGVLRIAGPDRTVNTEPVPAGSVVIGLRFQPGAISHWLRTPTPALVDQRIPLDEFWGSDGRHFGARVTESRDPEAIARHLEARQRAGSVRAPDRAAQTIFRAVDESDPSSPTDITQHLAAVVGVSERTLRRLSVAAFGYGPKTLQRVLRFQRFLRLASCPGSAGGLVGLSAASGYTDQAHLSREAVRMTGMTPKMILRQLPQ